MRLLKSAPSKGFTLLEIMVALGIMAIILTIGSFGLNFSNYKTNLNTAAELMVSNIRSTAFMSLNNQQFQDSVTTGWGVYFDATSNSYTIFTDLTGDSLYNDTKEKVKTITLPRNIIINNLQFKGDTGIKGSLYFQIGAATPVFQAIDFTSDPDNLNIKLSNRDTGDSVHVYINSLGMVNLQ